MPARPAKLNGYRLPDGVQRDVLVGMVKRHGIDTGKAPQPPTG